MKRYSPIGNPKEKKRNNVIFCEANPPEHLASVVHRYIKISTDRPLGSDYQFHALPDACTYLIFDQLKPDVVGPTSLGGKSMEFNLGKIFHYVNIRFFPGVWQTDREKPFIGQINQPYDGDLPLLIANQELLNQPFNQQQKILNKYVEYLVYHKILVTSVIITRILREINSINSVAEMAEATKVSTRHLQRRLKQETGFTPHDFLKVIRLQRSLSGSDIDQYSDQSHFIRSFRHVTGKTPAKFYEEFDV